MEPKQIGELIAKVAFDAGNPLAEDTLNAVSDLASQLRADDLKIVISSIISSIRKEIEARKTY